MSTRSFNREGEGNPDLLGVPTSAELASQKAEMQKKGATPESIISESEQHLRDAVPEIGDQKWFSVGNV